MGKLEVMRNIILFLILSLNLQAQDYLGVTFNFQDQGLGLDYQHNSLEGGIGILSALYTKESSYIAGGFGYRFTRISSKVDFFTTGGIMLQFNGDIFTDDLKPTESYKLYPKAGFGVLLETTPVYFKFKFDGVWDQKKKDVGILFTLTVGARLSKRKPCENR